MKKYFAIIVRQIQIIAIASLLVPITTLSANKSSLSGGNGLDASKWSETSGDGTITCDGTNTIVGSGTVFQSQLFYAPAGSILYVDAVVIGTVLSIEDNTHLTLAAPSATGAFAGKAFTHQTVPMPGDNVTIVSPHVVTLLGVPGLTINDLTIDAGASCETDCNVFNLTGNLLVNGTFIQDATCRLIMDGSAATIGGSPTPVSIRSLRVKTTTLPSTVTLNSPIIVTEKLDLEDGTIYLNGQTLTIGTDDVNIGELLLHVGKYENITGPGTMTRWFAASTSPVIPADACAFPLSAGGINRHAWIGGTITAGGTVTVSQSETPEATPFTPYTEAQYFEYRSSMNWTISSANSFSAHTMSLRLQGSGLSGVSAVSDLTMSVAGGIADGTFAASTGVTPADPQVNRAFADQSALAGTYYFASTSGSPMPVELASFTAAAKGRAIILRWNTATEKNNYGFEIERRTTTSAAPPSAVWTKIGFADGHGTSATPHSYSFADNTVGGSYAYRLKQIDRDGRSAYSTIVEAALAMSASDYSLTQNYPNPFNPATNIHFMLKATQRATLTVYNALGQEVATLFDGVAEGNMMQTVVFDASRLSSGVYFYALRSGENNEVRKMQLLR